MKKIIFTLCLIIFGFFLWISPSQATIVFIALVLAYFLYKLPFMILRSKWYRRREKLIQIRNLEVEIRKQHHEGLKLIDITKNRYEINIKLNNLKKEYEQI